MTTALRRALLGATLPLALLGCGSRTGAPETFASAGLSTGTPAGAASGGTGTAAPDATATPESPWASSGAPASAAGSPGTGVAATRPEPPVAGTYTYALTVNGGQEQTVTVVVEAARPDGRGGSTLRTRTHLAGGYTSISTVTWNASGAFTTRTETSGPTGTSTAVCTPASKDLAFPLAAGTSWTYQGTCENRTTGSAEVTRSRTRTAYRCTARRTLGVLGRTEPVWVLEESTSTTSKGSQPNAVAATSTTTNRRELLEAYRIPGLVTSTTKDTGLDGKPRTTTTRLELRAAVPA